jgi:glycosyltransferase involved in cell wall biosynthesis
MKLSIITVNRNNDAGLEKTIKSVIGQSAADFEYIIIDGASTDGSVDIIKKYAEKIQYWVSEPDAGIYNAMNKGIKKASGDFCLFLNSGDCLMEKDTLSKVFMEIDGYKEADIYYSDVIKANNSVLLFPDNLTIDYLIKSFINHQNTIIKTSLFVKHGFYNEELTIVSDWEFFLKELWIYKTKFVHINANIALYEGEGISIKNAAIREKEKIIVYKNVFGEISDTIIDLYHCRNTIYADILYHWGNTGLLDFLLKTYRFFARRFMKDKNA